MVFGLADLALFTYPLLTSQVWPAMVLIALAGFPAAASMAGLTTFAQTVAGADRAGMVFGLIVTAQAGTSLIGTSLAGVLGGRMGIIPTLCLHAGGLMLAGLLVVAGSRRGQDGAPRVRP
ncbi:hypothetical protein [Nonomuraea salmonea]|uniref:hypothetical protein n=1 Tax=Nonomuraea salmonea TaxID=46181 RepID=UPI002FEA6B6C